MTLNDCTKAELLFVIESLRRHHFSNGDYYVQMALLDVEAQRDKARFEEADRLSKLSSKKLQEYTSLIAPYEGQPIGKIPYSVIVAADKLLDEAKEADRKWAKLMGVNLSKPKGGKK